VQADDGRRGHEIFLDAEFRLLTAFQARSAKGCSFSGEPDPRHFVEAL
jgi:hypothetical protein